MRVSLREEFPNGHERAVPVHVPICVVDILEEIDIHHDKAVGDVLGGGLERSRENAVQVPAVVKSSEVVLVGECIKLFSILSRFHRFLSAEALVGDICYSIGCLIPLHYTAYGSENRMLPWSLEIAPVLAFEVKTEGKIRIKIEMRESEGIEFSGAFLNRMI